MSSGLDRMGDTPSMSSWLRLWNSIESVVPSWCFNVPIDLYLQLTAFVSTMSCIYLPKLIEITYPNRLLGGR